MDPTPTQALPPSPPTGWSAPTTPSPQPGSGPPKKKGGKRKWIVGGVVVVLALGAIGSLGNPSDPAPAAATPAPAAAEVTTPTPATPAPSATPTATVTPSPATTTAPTPAVALVKPPKLSAKIAGAKKVRYFSIAGTSPSELIADVVNESKPYCKSKDTLACVLNVYRPHWVETTYSATGSCKVTSAGVTLSSTVWLPRWTSPSRVQPALATWWKKMFDHFAWHEGRHIKIQRTYGSKLRSLLVGHRCSKARAIVKKWQQSLNAAQDTFDLKDSTWPYPEYTAP